MATDVVVTAVTWNIQMKVLAADIYVYDIWGKRYDTGDRILSEPLNRVK